MVAVVAVFSFAGGLSYDNHHSIIVAPLTDDEDTDMETARCCHLEVVGKVWTLLGAIEIPLDRPVMTISAPCHWVG
jgi:hypothetical protein